MTRLIPTWGTNGSTDVPARHTSGTTPARTTRGDEDQPVPFPILTMLEPTT
jgi:hypothetical protein